ncbi:MAG TPA: TlyA family RNA methyltransferase [Candidatus Dormibacteraeota bacterium]|nr:TlyA family RNA methyltransferase [Candidatus Dormibacteraeota bacterium]HEX2680258.1 TlyA family RNA methyltransferase [Candidatus Dormibacteraeota bacterium]
MPRLDVLVTRSGLAESRERAQALILAGKVRVAGETVRRPDRTVRDDAAIAVDSEPAYASRGALKLAPALEAFGVDPRGRVCADIGASTGGFTDVLLRRGAAKVYAVDVGRGLLHWRLRQDPRVVLIEKVNARDLEGFPEPVGLVVIDVSFISLNKVLPAVRRAAPDAEVVALFKPQFEVRRADVGKGGIVRDPGATERALAGFRDWCATNGYAVKGQAPSEVPGAEGNREVFVHLMPVPQ